MKSTGESIKLLAAGCVAAVCALPAAVAAQAFPTKPVRFIVPFPPGGATDTFSRAIAIDLTKSLGQQVIVENRPGAGTIIGAELVAKSPPDGHTLFFTDLSTHTITGSLYAKLNYHPLRDFAAVAPVNSSPLLLVAHPSVNVKTARQLIDLAKRQPGITFGNSGVGTVTHMASEKFGLRAGIKITPVSYKGGAVPVIALLSGEIATVVTTIPASLQHVRAGKLVAIGLTSDKRSPSLPGIAALGETVKDVDAAIIAGVLAPAGTPPGVIQRLNAEIVRTFDNPKVKELFEVNAAEPLRMSPAEMQRSLEQDVKNWAAVVKATGVTVK
jgi:tripartite-type tricarboxylate transporter receptor subunit TctC